MMGSINHINDIELGGIELLVDEKIAKITAPILDQIMEYSCSLPTGTKIGKIWKRDINWSTVGKDPEWYIGHYFKQDGKDTLIEWYKVDIIPECSSCGRIAEYFIKLTGQIKGVTAKCESCNSIYILNGDKISRQEYEDFENTESVVKS
jgi:hypothetical protein